MLGPATGPGDPRYEIPNARGVGRRDLGCLKIPHKNCRTEGVFHHHHDPFFGNKPLYIPKNIQIEIGYKKNIKIRTFAVGRWNFQG